MAAEPLPWPRLPSPPWKATDQIRRALAPSLPQETVGDAWCGDEFGLVPRPRRKMTWVGVGNVSGFLLRAHPGEGRPREVLLPRGGVVGYRLPTLYSVTVLVAAGDTLLFATDGIRSSFTDRLTANGSPGNRRSHTLRSHPGNGRCAGFSCPLHRPDRRVNGAPLPSFPQRDIIGR